MKNHLGNLNNKDYSLILLYPQLQSPTEQLYMEKKSTVKSQVRDICY